VAHDVDRDGAFTVSDITLVQRYLAEFCDLTALQQELADANGAGVNISDVTSLQRIMADMGS
ncbi:MAG: dockerin type I repeat-containing protein, partial [Ruminococcus sp.]|nr:dockerin type I repeat-containing protein [Ruminococcus sp.]